MKILLADDEVQVLKQLELLIDWPKHGYELATARNGREVIEILQTQQIDLLCLDINMPLMSGLEVLDWIDKEKIRVAVIVISCQDDFNIVKDAMKHRVLDYILKNTITPDSILALLSHVKTKMNQDFVESSRLIEIHHQAEQKRQYDLNNQFKYWLTTNEQSNFNIKNLFPDSNEFMMVKVFALKINNYTEIIRRYTSNDINAFYDLVENILRNIFKKYNMMWFRSDNFKFTILIQFHKNSSDSCNSCIHELHHDLYRILSISSFILIGKEYDELNDLKSHYWTNDILETCIFFYGENQLLFTNECTIIKNSHTFVHGLMKATLPSLEKQNYELFELMIEEQIQTMKLNKEIIHKQEFLSCIRNILFLASQTLKIECVLFDITDITTIENMMNRLRQYFVNFTKSETKNSHTHIVFFALNYIKEHYSDDLSLGDIASALNVSAGYLSRIFSSVQNTTIVNYIADYRIQIAKKMIAETNLKFYDIASKVGFTSAITFSTTFKKIVGITPGQFRDSIIKQSIQ